jgi:hypothetical protein
LLSFRATQVAGFYSTAAGATTSGSYGCELVDHVSVLVNGNSGEYFAKQQVVALVAAGVYVRACDNTTLDGPTMAETELPLNCAAVADAGKVCSWRHVAAVYMSLHKLWEALDVHARIKYIDTAIGRALGSNPEQQCIAAQVRVAMRAADGPRPVMMSCGYLGDQICDQQSLNRI